MSGTTRRAAAVGVDARTSAARSQSGVSCSCPTAETIGTVQSATARTTRSSEKGSRSSKLPPPRASTITSAPRRHRSPIAVAIATARAGLARTSRRRATLAGGKRCTMCVSTSRFAAASLPVTRPISRGKRGSGRLRAAANSPSAASFSSAVRARRGARRGRSARSSAPSVAARPRCSYSSAGRRRVRARRRRGRARSASNWPRGICAGRHAPSSGILEREEHRRPALLPAQLGHLALDPERRQPR